MKRRRRGKAHGRHRRERPGKAWNNPLPDIPVPRRLEILASPELRLLMQTGQAFFEYLMAKIPKGLPSGPVGDLSGLETERIKAEIEAEIMGEIQKGHPEAIETKIDERQEGRSEVIGEIARPKPG